jgi:hypothetical protein
MLVTLLLHGSYTFVTSHSCYAIVTLLLHFCSTIGTLLPAGDGHEESPRHTPLDILHVAVWCLCGVCMLLVCCSYGISMVLVRCSETSDEMVI